MQPLHLAIELWRSWASSPAAARDDTHKDSPDAVGNWTWHGTTPHTMEADVYRQGYDQGGRPDIHDPIGGEKIYRATDTYPAGSYDGKTETTVLCTGDGGADY